MEFNISLEDSPRPEDVAQVVEGLTAFNRLYAPVNQYRALVIFLRDSIGEILGGLVAETYWGWLHVQILWIDEAFRGRGFGARLLARAEQEAVWRGCHYAYLDTLSFQARDFYEAKGYRFFGALTDHPVGHSRYFLSKELHG
jgi:GNAT superfamily N-acetyltransferase